MSPLVKGAHHSQLRVRYLNHKPLLVAKGIRQRILKEQSLPESAHSSEGQEEREGGERYLG
jgi:hypothetical protein